MSKVTDGAMTRCNRHDLRDRSLCHKCTRFQRITRAEKEAKEEKPK